MQHARYWCSLGQPDGKEPSPATPAIAWDRL